MKSKFYLSVITSLFILSACSGGKDRTIINGAVVSSGDAQQVTPTDVAASAGDQVIVPTGTPPADPSQETPPASDATPPPPAPPASASIASFNVTKVPTGRLNTVKIDWSFSNAKAAYLWGDFNREETDTSCGVVNGRALVTGPDGNQLNEGSVLYQQNLPYLEGILCDNANQATNDECQSPSVSASLRDGLPRLASRFSGLSARRDLYFYDLSKAENAHAVDVMKEEAPGSMVAHPIDPSIFGEPNPRCRIDLAKDAALIPSGTLTTRSLAQHGNFCLAVQGGDDAWTVNCKNSEAPAASLNANSDSVKISAQKPVVTLDFNYAHAAAAPTADGCDATDGSSGPDADGSGHYHAECRINKETMKIRVGVQGLGKWNTESHTYLAVFGKPQATMTPYGVPPSADEQGPFKLHYEADRSCTLKDVTKNEILGDADARCPWVNGIELYGQYVYRGNKIENPNFHKVEKAADAKGEVTAFRDYTYHFWSFSAFDFEGFPHVSNVVHEDFDSSLNVLVNNDGSTSLTSTCSKKLKWKKMDGIFDVMDQARFAATFCGDDWNDSSTKGCYDQLTDWTYGGDHELQFALEMRNVTGVTVNCRASIDVANLSVTADLPEVSVGDVPGYDARAFDFKYPLPTFDCRIDYQTADGTPSEFSIQDLCLGRDYGNDAPTKADVARLFQESGYQQ